MKRILWLFGVLITIGAYAQTETTQWYIDTELYDTTTCESGGDINVPTTPTKYGYTFQGWIPAVYDMSTLDPSINGTYAAKNVTWLIEYSYGIVHGTFLCSELVPDAEQTGLYCWCRVTDFVPTGSRIVYEPKSSPWALNYVYDSVSFCSKNCVFRCGDSGMTNTTFRKSLFGIGS